MSFQRKPKQEHEMHMDVTGLGGGGGGQSAPQREECLLVHALSWKYVGSSRIAQGS